MRCHLIRELTAVAETYPDAIWPAQARTALATLAAAARTAREAGLDHLPPADSAEPLRLLRHAVLVGLAQHPRADGRKQSKARNLLERLRDREAEILRFTVDLDVPFGGDVLTALRDAITGQPWTPPAPAP